jgi:hypothetical protein
LFRYNVEWHIAPLRIQKLILFLLQKGTKSFNIVIGGLFIASLEGFAKVKLINTCIRICILDSMLFKCFNLIFFVIADKYIDILFYCYLFCKIMMWFSLYSAIRRNMICEEILFVYNCK